jgi:hypothetical protein
MGDSVEFPVRDGHAVPDPVLPRRSLSSNTLTRAFLSMEGSRLTKASTSSSRTSFLSLAFNSGRI